MQEWTLIIRRILMRALHQVPLAGSLALLTALLLVALPTAIRAVVHGSVTGCEFTPYLVFVLIGALLLRWWLAGAVALSAVAIMGGYFFAPIHDGACFLSSAAMFLASSAGMIGIVMMVRGVIAAIQRRGADKAANGIVFSLREGEVWASWYDEDPPLRLGSRSSVAEMMKDFLAQEEVGNRLTGRR
jgi:hypothetical protein